MHGTHRPDVIFQLRGLRVVIEGKFADTSNARDLVIKDARKRVVAGIAHIAVAVVYPNELRNAPTTEITEVLGRVHLVYRVITEAFESDRWFEGQTLSLMEALRRAQESLSKDDLVEKTAKALSVHLEKIAKIWIGQPGSCDRLSKLLKIPIPQDEDKNAALDRRETATKISALVLANAFIFQEQLALCDERVDTLRKLRKSDDVVSKTSIHWQWIWTNINYVPIFQLGERILNELPASPSTTSVVSSLLDEAHNICSKQAALRHDLMGRIYHRLLHDAKYLGTFYTSVSAATLLLKLVFDLVWQKDFAALGNTTDFKIGDLACGTGTLMMASAQALTDSFIMARVNSAMGVELTDLSALHSTLMHDVLFGYDILPSAVHLTASTLALLAPEVAFRKMNLFVMPIGTDHLKPRLGSLDFLGSNEIQTQLSLDSTHLETIQTGASQSENVNATVPELDLCVMNPPFVSSRYGNRLFGSLPKDRPLLQKALRAESKKLGISATAGLGALFVPLADRHTKPGGRIAFVLPMAITTGEAWGTVRQYLANRYHLEVVVSSHDPSRNNFSENTDLSEVLFIARKLKKDEKSGNTTYVNLHRNPTTIYGAIELANRITEAMRSIGGKQKNVTIRSSEVLYGEITSVQSPKNTENWTNAVFAQSYLAQVYSELELSAHLGLPGSSKCYSIPLCQLSSLGRIGYDIRDITDAFEVDYTSKKWSPYPGFWNHNAEQVVSIVQEPNAFLTARKEPLKGRKLKDAETIWNTAGEILLVSRLWPITQKVIATGFQKKVLGNTWWAFDNGELTSEQNKALLLWFNSTLGLLFYFGRRAITRSAWIQMKKPAWQTMSVLNVRKLNSAQLLCLAESYDQIASKSLCPLAQLDTDPIRIQIDDAICEVLQLPALHTVRELLVSEPGLTGKASAQGAI